MTQVEITIDPTKLETVPDNTIYDDIKRWTNTNFKKIIAFFFISIIISVILIVVLQKNPEFPCMLYSPTTLASSVSVKCLQYVWTKTGCVQKGSPPISDNYNGFYLRSPQGPAYVRCDALHTGNNCGVGNYATIVTNFQLCNINYN